MVKFENADKVWENNLVITENDISRERDKWSLTVGIVYSNCWGKKNASKRIQGERKEGAI